MDLTMKSKVSDGIWLHTCAKTKPPEQGASPSCALLKFQYCKLEQKSKLLKTIIGFSSSSLKITLKYEVSGNMI